MMVSRSGPLSLFSALQECCPSAVRNDDIFIGKHGMTEIEFHKVLEKHGFVKLRDRIGKPGTTDSLSDTPSAKSPKGAIFCPAEVNPLFGPISHRGSGVQLVVLRPVSRVQYSTEY